jgi:flagellar basal body rod protein FlgF
LVSPSQYVIGFEDNKISYYNPFIKKDEDITLNLEMDEATGNVTYTSTQSINVDVTSSGEIKFKPIFENSSSIYISKNIMYEIIYDNTSQINYNKSIFIYHSNE